MSRGSPLFFSVVTSACTFLSKPPSLAMVCSAPFHWMNLKRKKRKTMRKRRKRKERKKRKKRKKRKRTKKRKKEKTAYLCLDPRRQSADSFSVCAL